MMEHTIEITAKDIAAGQPVHGTRCPVALAFGRELGEKVFTLSHSTVAFRSGKTLYHSEPLKRFVGKFDKGEPVAPGVFTYTISNSERV